MYQTKPLKASLVAILLLVSSGCVGSPERSLAVACQGYASTLTSLAAAKARGQLSPSQIATVDATRPALNAICLDGDYSDPLAARDAVEAAMWSLIQVERGIQ